MAHGLHGLLRKHGFYGFYLYIRVTCVRSADAVIRVPIVPIISTRMTRIAAQARILWILFIYPCNIRVIRVLIHPVNEIRIYLCSFFLSLSNNLRRNSGFLPKFKSKLTSILVARR